MFILAEKAWSRSKNRGVHCIIIQEADSKQILGQGYKRWTLLLKMQHIDHTFFEFNVFEDILRSDKFVICVLLLCY